jgi:hypothetical protein
MALAVPTWAIGSAASSGPDGQPDKRAKMGDHTFKKEMNIEDILQILLKLSLQNSEAIRDLTGAVFVTYLIPMTGELYIKLDKKGKEYHENTVGKSPEDHLLGPPFLHLWIVMLSHLHDKATDNSKKIIGDYWTNSVLKKPREELEAEVQYMRLRRKGADKKNKTQSQIMKGEFRVLQMRVEDEELAKAIDITIIKDGAVKKLGAAPRSGLERAAQDILAKYNKK